MIPRVMYRRITTKEKQQVCTVVKRYRPLDETFMSVLKRDQTKNTLLKELCHLKMKYGLNVQLKCNFEAKIGPNWVPVRKKTSITPTKFMVKNACEGICFPFMDFWSTSSL